MTFRFRLVLVAAVAVIVAVLGASIASYFVARASLLDSVDSTQTATFNSIKAQTIEINARSSTVAGLGYQIVDAHGSRLYGSGIPVGNAASVARNGRPYFANVTVRGADYRELVERIPVSVTTTTRSRGIRIRTVQNSALQLVTPLNGVDTQLTHLGLLLTFVAIIGIAIALLLAWLVGRTSLAPLDELVNTVEEVAATTDISRRLDPGPPDELGRLRRAVNHLLTALDASQQSQRQLVLDAGHELRTPLTSLRTNLEVVRRMEELPPEDREVLVDDLLTQMDELTSLVGDLSELARGTQRPTEPTALRLDQLVEEAVAVATTHGRPRDVRFSLQAVPCWVRVQRDRVDRAVGNLLDNALKWSPDGTVVEVGCWNGEVTVRDHGPGISPEDLPHVFDRFYRAAAARALPGSGLGLAIVAQVAEAEGGSVTAGTAVGGGALFRLRLPTLAPPAESVDDEDDVHEVGVQLL